MKNSIIIGFMSLLITVLIICPNVFAESKPFSDKEICLAALSTVNMWSKNPTGGQSKVGKYIKSESNTYYFRSSTSDWKCKIVNDKVMWGMKDGRWRNDPRDEVIKFGLSKNKITIYQIFTDGSKIEKNYTKKQIVNLSK